MPGLIIWPELGREVGCQARDREEQGDGVWLGADDGRRAGHLE